MKIDIHAHLWPAGMTTQALNEYFAGRGLDPAGVLTAKGIIAAMAPQMELCVIAALAMQAGHTNKDLASVNTYVLEQIRFSGGKLAGLCTVDPFGGRESADMLRKYIKQDGFKGLKLHQNIQCFFPNDERLFPVYEELQALGKPVLFHTGGIGIKPLQDKYSDLACIEEVACLFPKMPILLGHAGRGKYDDVALMLRKHAHMYADVSANFAKLPGAEHLPLAELIRKVKIWTGGTGKLLFGSDYPFYGEEQTLELLGRIPKEERLVTEQDIENISFANAENFYKKYML